MFLALKKYFLKLLLKTRGVKHRTTFNYTLIFADVFKFVKSLFLKMFEQLIRKQTQLKIKRTA